ncbi:MAG: Inhibitor of sigma-G Gin [Pelotomaculum sp. PtaU1.Bin035]|nr:MAG: Inhibitor of sigma-G Gin [Pelotomaculum sp. PtaU1.Bin035]
MPVCIICGQMFKENKQGLFINGHYICPECENGVVALSADDPGYNFYKMGLKKIWCFSNA